MVSMLPFWDSTILLSNELAIYAILCLLVCLISMLMLILYAQKAHGAIKHIWDKCL